MLAIPRSIVSDNIKSTPTRLSRSDMRFLRKNSNASLVFLTDCLRDFLVARCRMLGAMEPVRVTLLWNISRIREL